MSGHIRITSSIRADVGAYEPLGGETLTMDGTPQTLTIPSDASIVQIEVETAVLYYDVLSALASVNSHGFIPANGARVIGPLSRFGPMSIFGVGGGGAIAHIQYFRIV